MKQLLAVFAAAFLAACGEGTYPDLPSREETRTANLVDYNIHIKLTDSSVLMESRKLFVRISSENFEKRELTLDGAQASLKVSLPSDFAGQVTVSVENQLRLLTQGVEVIFDTVNACADEYGFTVTLPLNLHECKNEPTEPEGQVQTKLVSLEEGWMTSCMESTITSLNANKSRLSWTTLDMEHLSDASCRATILSWKRSSGTKVHCYVNPQEFFTSIPERVWQHSLRSELVISHPEFALKTTAGSPVSVWPGMEMNNMTDGSYVEWIATKYTERVNSSSEINEICDGLHVDNMNYIMSWIIDFYGQLNAVYANQWDFDVLWANGLKSLVAKLRTKLPEKEISCRSKSHKFGEICDMVLFESGIKLGSETDIPGGLFGRLWQMWMMQETGTKVTLHHHVKEFFEEGTLNQHLAQEVESGYAAALVMGVDYSFDLRGPDHHGEFVMYSIFDDLGKSTSSTQWPFAIKHNTGDFSITASTRSIGSVNGSDVVVFWRELFGGVYGSSVMTGVGDGNSRWNLGPYVGPLSNQSLSIGISGTGTLSVEGLKVFDTNDASSTGYFYRSYEKGEAYFNVTETSIEVMTQLGRKLVVPAGRGCVVYWDSPKTTCTLR